MAKLKIEHCLAGRVLKPDEEKAKNSSFLTKVNVYFSPELGTFKLDYSFKVQHTESTNSP